MEGAKDEMSGEGKGILEKRFEMNSLDGEGLERGIGDKDDGGILVLNDGSAVSKFRASL